MTKRRHRGRGVLTLAFASVVLAATAAVPIAAAAGTTAPTGGRCDRNGLTRAGLARHERGDDDLLPRRRAPALGDIDVVGDITGRHTGHWTDHSDNDGASFAPSQPFASDEHVVVHTHVAVEGGSGDGFSFTTAHTVRALPVSDPLADDMPVASGAATAPAATTPVSTFRTRPDLTPPVLTTDLARGATSPGLIAISPRGSVQAGPMLIDNSGQIVWDQPVTAFNTVLDTEMVTYGGKPALSFWEGAGVQAGDPGQFVVVDDSYRTVATIRAGNGYQADIHDLLITPRNTAYLMAYGSVARNLTAFGGVANGTVIDLIVQEIDIATGAVRFEWHSLDHIPLSESLVAAPADAQHSWDYLHGNALEIDRDGNLLVSGRHASAVWKVNRSTGALMWTLGRGGDFTPVGFADADWFGYQHDIRRWPDGTLSVFDNGSNGLVDNRPYSRGLVLSVDEKNMTVSIVRIYRAPARRAGDEPGFVPLSSRRARLHWLGCRGADDRVRRRRHPDVRSEVSDRSAVVPRLAASTGTVIPLPRRTPWSTGRRRAPHASRSAGTARPTLRSGSCWPASMRLTSRRWRPRHGRASKRRSPPRRRHRSSRSRRSTPMAPCSGRSARRQPAIGS